jgi:predicted RNase H-like nuclease (RuvC/YqgF family)
MSKTTAKELVNELGVSRARLYQIIAKLDDDQKPRKNALGQYIFDDQAVENIKQYYTKLTIKHNTNSVKHIDSKTLDTILTSINSHVSDLEEQVQQLTSKLTAKEQQIASLEAEKEAIRQNKDQQLTKLTKESNEQIAELHKLLDQQQRLNLATSEQNKKLLDQPAAKKHWWQ